MWRLRLVLDLGVAIMSHPFLEGLGVGIWSNVLIVAVWVLIVFVGQPPLWVNVGTAALVVVVVSYLGYRQRRGFSNEFVRGNLLYLFPGHMLLLLGLSLTHAFRSRWWWAWLALVVSSLMFDAVAHRPWPFGTRKRAAMALYVVVWGAIFYLFHELVYFGGRFQAAGLNTFSVMLTLFGLAYIGLAVYRFTRLQPANE